MKRSTVGTGTLRLSSLLVLAALFAVCGLGSVAGVAAGTNAPSAESASPSPMSEVVGLPSGTMKINNGAAATNNIHVIVNSAVTGATKMRFGTYNGSGYSWTDGWRAYSGSSPLILPEPDGQKAVIGQYVDASGGTFTTPDVYIVLDRIAPKGSMKINGGATGTNKLTVEATCAVSGAATMRFGVFNKATGKYDWTNPQPYATRATFSLRGPDGEKALVGRFSDAAGNLFTTPAVRIFLDRTIPSGTMKINGGAKATNRATVKITSAVTGATQMSFGVYTNDVFQWTAPRKYAPVSYLTLPEPDGTKAVQARYTDPGGNVLTTPVTYITLDRVAPAGTVRLNKGATATRVLTTPVDSAVAGASRMRFRVLRAAGWDNPKWKAYAAASSVKLYSPDGTRSVQAEYKDQAGNVFKSPVMKVKFDRTAPTVLSLLCPSHANFSHWYADSNPQFSWTPRGDFSGVTGYSFALDKVSGTVPDKMSDSGGDVRTKYVAGVADGRYFFHVRAVDNAGNWGPAIQRTIRIDTAPPVTTVSGVDDGWHRGAVTMKLTARDAGSGVKAKQYSLNDGASYVAGSSHVFRPVYTGELVKHTVLYRSIDKAGLTETPKSCEVKLDGRDLVAPKVTAPRQLDVVTVNHGATRAILIRLSDAAPSCGSATVRIQVLTGSGAEAQALRLDNVPLNKNYYWRYRGTLPVAHYGMYLSVVDADGNASAVRQVYLHVDP